MREGLARRLDAEGFSFGLALGAAVLVVGLFDGRLWAPLAAIAAAGAGYALVAFTPLGVWMRARRSPSAMRLVSIVVSLGIADAVFEHDPLVTLAVFAVLAVLLYLLLTRTALGRRLDAWDRRNSDALGG